MIEIANSTDPHGMLQKDIAANQNISLKYLDPIIASLKLKGLITNSRGKGSGYRLSRAATEITMLDIYTAFEQIIVIECINNLDFCERVQHDCKGRCFWNEFREDFIAILAKKNLQQIVNETYFECKDLDLKELQALK